MIEFILPIICAGVIAFVIMMYVVLDGFDLGIGILFPFIKGKTEREIMMSTVSPVWDGNETWMVLGGASLYGAFPVVYSTLLPLFYMPIMLMLAALIFRGIAFEFLFKSNRIRFMWDNSFIIGSILAAFMQGLILGSYLSGFADYGTTGGFGYHWLSGFSLLTGIAVVFGYALLGSTWLIGKTVGELQTKMFNYAKICLLAVALFIAIVSIWTPYVDTNIEERWFSLPNFFYLLPLPVITGLIILYLYWCLVKGYEKRPFYLSIAIFVLAYAGLGISLWPNIIPNHLNIWQAASPPSSQWPILLGQAILLPILLGYTFYQYHIFRGKVTKAEHY